MKLVAFTSRANSFERRLPPCGRFIGLTPVTCLEPDRPTVSSVTAGGTLKRTGRMLVPMPVATKQMPAVLDHMARGETLTINGRHDRRAHEREAHLAAVRMARERQRHAIRDIGKDVRVVGEQQNGRPIGLHAGESRLDVVRSWSRDR